MRIKAKRSETKVDRTHESVKKSSKRTKTNDTKGMEGVRTKGGDVGQRKKSAEGLFVDKTLMYVLHTSYLVGLSSVLYELKVHFPPAVRAP